MTSILPVANEIELRHEPTLAAVEDNIDRLLAVPGTTFHEAESRAWRLARARMRDVVEKQGIPVFEACEIPGKEPMPLEKTRQAVANYNQERGGKGPSHEGPAKLTHSGKTAYGWAKSLSLRGSTVYAKFRDTSHELLDALIKRQYPNRSAELERGGRSFKGFAFLGADEPAIRLANFSADAAASADPQGELALQFCFSAAELGDNHYQGDTMDKDDKTKADATVRVVFGADAGGGAGGQQAREFSQTEFDAEVERRANEKAREKQLEFEAEQKKQAEKQRQQADTDFCEQLVADGKVPPGDRDFHSAVLAKLGTPVEGEQALHFAADSGGTVQRSAYEEYRRRLGNIDKSGLFSQHAPQGSRGLGGGHAPQRPEAGQFDNGHKRLEAKLQYGVETRDYVRDMAEQHKLSFRSATIVHGYAEDNGLDFAAALKQVRHQLPAEEGQN